jgi:hypothetical protein
LSGGEILRKTDLNNRIFDRPTPTESREQIALFQWAAIREKQCPELKNLFCVPNGGARDAITGARLKREGVKTGVPDILLLVARGEYHGLAIEMKRIRGGKLLANQKTWLNRLNAQGYKAVACKGATEAIAVIEDYLKEEAR